MASVVRDVEQEERERGAEIATEEVRVTIVREVELALDHRVPFTPATYVPRVHFFVPQGCDTYTPLLPVYLDTSVIRDRSTHIAYRNPLVCTLFILLLVSVCCIFLLSILIVSCLC